MKGLFCHVSFINSLSERRVCIIPNSPSLLNKLDGVKSPCVIDVKSSVSFKFEPEEIEDDADKEMLLIWDFDIHPGLSASAAPIKPLHPNTDSIPTCPLMRQTESECNCSNFPNPGKVSLGSAPDNHPQGVQYVGIQSDESDCADDYNSDHDDMNSEHVENITNMIIITATMKTTGTMIIMLTMI